MTEWNLQWRMNGNVEAVMRRH